MKKIKKIAILCLVVGFALLFIAGLVLKLSGFHRYRGDHKDLYTVAVNNIFGIYGRESNGELVYDPEIRIIETDDYGRVLFFYSEYYDGYLNDEADYGMAIVIMQSSKDGYAYYYRDQCYMPCFDVTDDWETISAKLASETLEELKNANDWGRELNEERCVKAKLTEKKPEGKLQPEDAVFDQILFPYMLRNGYTGRDRSICRYSVYCETDAYGKELYYVYGATKDPGVDGETVYASYDFAVILNADGTCPQNGIAEIPALADSAAVISKLKLDTNWNGTD